MRTFRTVLIVLFVVGLCTLPAQAQRTSGAVGLGAQLGDPAGVGITMYNATAPSYDFLGAWSLTDDFFFLNGHALFNHALSTENVNQDVGWFAGPGAFIGAFEDNNEFGDEAVIGASVTLGLRVLFQNQFSLYGRLTPRLALIPETEGAVGGGVGFRYYF